MPKQQLKPAKEREAAGDAAGAVADLVRDDQQSTWEAIIRRNPTIVPRWVSGRPNRKTPDK